MMNGATATKAGDKSTSHLAAADRSRPETIAHFGIRCQPDKYKELVDWHCKFWGARIILSTDIHTMITWDDEHHRLVILNNPDHEQPSNKRTVTGIYHMAFSYPTLASLAQGYEEKKALGIKPHWPVNHGMSTSMYYFDPDGNEFEMQVDNFATAAEAHDFMASLEFVENQIGVDFDPEEFVRRVKSGESEEIIKKRPRIGVRYTRWDNSMYFKPEDRFKTGASSLTTK
ncbi:Glyoxalase/Bleomycin resistance protein/Dihydroxybiphenyl dioxygenase [Leptodontidium sp. MPI-SDFR-AT-0119]|nr:Glyoxalase/Bleomycin resistance protein/Dihydroxybiphenyl dioxygenase [Leptodontidium sp. MPI-SDFR-AT-0119]